ncbi:hypothetical protein [Alkalibacillus aidingensis]|uniref:hypothetical protein n=1 Tax=Alkalibacillus aidingensis TaxID=2747607 RepID=UPI0016613D68|nr:hypothetical protein [Alkalibacillus aidingensis]
MTHKRQDQPSNRHLLTSHIKQFLLLYLPLTFLLSFLITKGSDIPQASKLGLWALIIFIVYFIATALHATYTDRNNDHTDAGKSNPSPNLFNKWKIGGAVLLFIVFLITFELTKYASFTEATSDWLHEESEIKEISITEQFKDETGFQKDNERAIIKDEEQMEQILDVFSDINLKESDQRLHSMDMNYHVRFTVTNPTDENYNSTSSYSVYSDGDYLLIYNSVRGSYEITNDIDLKDFIEGLKEHDEIEWEELDS